MSPRREAGDPEVLGPRAIVRPLRAFVDELARAGVREAVVCPGSRSTPLALALRAHPRITVRVLLDERSAGFFALGMARTARRPVVLLGTSGTAAVNFAPAVVEAALARVPLVVLTADRPAELRDRGAPQTIDQLHLYGRHAKWFVELPLLDGTDATLAHVRSVAGRAVATALAGPAGPVHVDAPFREPLIPDGDLAPDAVPAGSRAAPFTDVVAGARTLAAADVAALARRFGDVQRGLIVAGPQDDPALPPALARLASATGWPIVADALSQVRLGAHDRSLVLARADLVARPGPWLDAHRPDLVVRFGAMPTSRALLLLLAEGRPAQLVVDGDAGYREAALLPTTFVHADATATAHALANALGAARTPARTNRLRAGPARRTAWADAWIAADRAADRAVRAWSAGVAARGEAFEGEPYPILADLLPDGALLWAGNSMPVRDMDAHLPAGPRSVRVLANRGANGIDGTVSTALGSAAVAGGPVILVVGDLAFLHDLNALVAARLHGLAATIVLVNNDGGGIFSFLPQASTNAPGAGLPARFEELFGTPHGIDVGPIVVALGGEHRRVAPGELRDALAASVGAPGVRVLELRTDRARNVALHREVAAAVAAALDELPPAAMERGSGGADR